MEGYDPKGLNTTFRRLTLEMILTRLTDLAKKSSYLSSNCSLNDLSLKFEESIYQKAANKQDYLSKVQQRLSEMMELYLPAPSPAGNQLGNMINSRHVVQSYLEQQNCDWDRPLEQTLLTGQYKTSSNQLQQNPQFAQQNQQFAQQNPQFAQQNQQFAQQNPQCAQQNPPCAQQNPHFSQQNQQFAQQNQQFEQNALFSQQNVLFGLQNQTLGQQNVVQRDAQYPLVQPNNILNIDSYKQSLESFHQLGNCQTQQTNYQASPLQGQINQYQAENTSYGSEMSNSYFQSQNYAGDRLVPQSPLSSTTAGSAYSPFSDAESTNADQCQLLIVQFQRARSSYLPELHKWLNMFQAQYRQASTMEQFDGPKKHILLIQQMIRLLNLSEHELLLYGRVKLRQNLNGIINYYNQMAKMVTSAAVNQVQQLSSVHRLAFTNFSRNVQPAPTMMNRPIISSSTMTPGLSYPQGTADYNALLNASKDPPILVQSSQTAQSLETQQSNKQTERVNEFADLMLKPVANSVLKVIEKRKQTMNNLQISKKPCLEAVGESSRNCHELPMTPSSVLKEIEDPVNSAVFELVDRNNGDTQVSIEANKCDGELELDELDRFLRTPERPVSPLVSDSAASEKNTQPDAVIRPIDRLINAVKSISKEALMSGVNDMRAAINEMDRLPADAYLDEHDWAVFLEPDQFPVDAFLDESNPAKDGEYNWAKYLEETDEVQPNQKIIRDVEAVSRDASLPFDNIHQHASATNFEASKDLLDEIKEANHRLFETVLKQVKTDSSNKSDGTIIRCTYNPITMSAETKRMFASESINLSVEFLVPFDYPISPPKILDCELPEGYVGIAVELTERAKSLFDSQVQCTDPLRVGEMAQAWDASARSVVLSYKNIIGGQTLSSKFSNWERVAQ